MTALPNAAENVWGTHLARLADTGYYNDNVPAGVRARSFEPATTELVYGVGCMRSSQPATQLPVDAIGFHLMLRRAAEVLGLRKVNCLVCYKLADANPASIGHGPAIRRYAKRHIALASKLSRLLDARSSMPTLTVLTDAHVVDTPIYTTVAQEYASKEPGIAPLVPYAAEQLRIFETFRRRYTPKGVIKGGWSACRTYEAYLEDQCAARLREPSTGTGACELAFDDWMEQFFPGWLLLHTREARAFTSDGAICGHYTAVDFGPDERPTRLHLGQSIPVETVVLKPKTDGKKRKWQEAIIEAIEATRRITCMYDQMAAIPLPPRIVDTKRKTLEELAQLRGGLLERMRAIHRDTGSTAGVGYMRLSTDAHALAVERADVMRTEELPRIRALMELFADC